MARYWPTERRELSRAMRRMQRDRNPGVPHVGCADANSVCASCGMMCRSTRHFKPETTLI